MDKGKWKYKVFTIQNTIGGSFFTRLKFFWDLVIKRKSVTVSLNFYSQENLGTDTSIELGDVSIEWLENVSTKLP